MKRQGQRMDLTSVPVAQKSGGKTSRQLLGEQVGESQDQVRRYIRLRNYFMKKGQPPQVCFDIVLSRKQWNHSELSKILDIDPDKTKNLLKLCDYQYDRVQMQYIQGEHAKEIKEKLMSIPCDELSRTF